MDGSRETRETPRWVAYCEGLLEGLSSALLIVDGDGRIVYANRAADELLAVVGRMQVGTAFDDPKLFESRGWMMRTADGVPLARDLHPFSVARRTGRPVLGEHVVIARPQGRMDLSIDAIPLGNTFGGTAGVGLVMSDVTESVGRTAEMGWMQRELVRIRREVEEALAFSETLNTVNDLVHSTLAFEDVLGMVLEAAEQTLEVEMASVSVRLDDVWTTSAVHRLPGRYVGRPLDGDELEPVLIAARQGAPLAVSDIVSDGRFPGLLERHGVGSFLIVPLVLRGEAFGTISFFRQYPSTFSYGQIGFASKVATTVSLAYGNARLYQEERHIAETLQQALLVLPPAVRGLEFSHLYRSATEAAWVGGDFFDVFDLPDDKVGILIGDVSGKGVEASALASFTRQIVKAHAWEAPSPAVVMDRANDLVFRISGSEDFVTVFFGVLDADGTLTYCNAGHPSPIAQRPGELGTFLEDGSPMIGAWDELTFTDSRTRLAEDEVLVLYTDGVIEAAAGGDLFGDSRLLDAARSFSRLPVPQIPAALFDEISRFTGGKLRDDVAVLCCKRRSVARS